MPKASRFTAGIIVRDGRIAGAANGSGETKLTQLRVIEASLTPASVAAATVAAQTLTVTGVSTSDNFVMCIKDPISNATAISEVEQNGANSVSIRFINPTAGALTPTAGTYVFLVGRYTNT